MFSGWDLLGAYGPAVWVIQQEMTTHTHTHMVLGGTFPLLRWNSYSGLFPETLQLGKYPISNCHSFFSFYCDWPKPGYHTCAVPASLGICWHSGNAIVTVPNSTPKSAKEGGAQGHSSRDTRIKKISNGLSNESSA